MVKKLVTGFAISVGAGLALAAANREKNKNGMWHPATAGGTGNPVTIRVHTAAPRNEQAHLEIERPASEAEFNDGPVSLQRSAELAEMKSMIETLDQRGNELMCSVNQRIDDLQSHLPRFIDVKVTARIREVEERLRLEFQDEQSKTLDAFLRTLEQKVLPRLKAIEEAMEAHGVEIGQMRQRIDKTDDMLNKLLERVGKAADSAPPPHPEYAKSHVTAIQKKAVA